MEPNRPRSRDKHVTSGGSGVHRRGSGLGTGPVGQGGPGRPSGVGNRAAQVGGGTGLLGIIIVIVLVIISKGGKGGDLLGTLLDENGNSGSYSYYSDYTGAAPAGFDFGNDSGQFTGNVASSSTSVNSTVADGARDKYTHILGGGSDTVTMMIYMCGTDLESKYGMASSDMQEIANATLGSNLNILIYTGGCSGWRTSAISSSTNQIWQVQSGGIKPLVKDDGAKSMTEPATLTHFIQYCSENFPANRYELILWDHGGGSVSGYGYDEKYKSAGSMGLSGIRTALKNGGVQFDFIGFDACLMATAETALMLDPYADYLIASEESEPGIGWYYTNWVNQFSANTSMATLDIGKIIVDDFITECGRRCAGQKTTLSVIDLAEFSYTVPSELADFSRSISNKIYEDAYSDVSNARYSTREFAESSKIDQVDLVHFAMNLGTPAGNTLASALQNAVKYNRTSSNMTNAYGVSIYFPYKRLSYVDKACNIYSQIGIMSEYSDCIRQFASIETSGQAASGGTTSPIGALLGLFSSGTSGSSSSGTSYSSSSSGTSYSSDGTSYSSSSYSYSYSSSGGSLSYEEISTIINTFISSRNGINGLDESNTGFMEANPYTEEQTAEYISMHYFDPTNLVWTQNDRGDYTMTLPESQWELVQSLDLNMFYDDGTGYVDMGLDNVYGFDDAGNLVADTDGTWVSINGQPVAYYHTDTMENGSDYTISGYVPALLNGERVNLILVFDQDNPNGYIAGATADYVSGETDTVAKSLTELNVGDTLDFICDYYSYDQTYLDSYFLGEQMTVSDHMEISNTSVGDGSLKLMYRFTDIYNQQYWTPAIDK